MISVRGRTLSCGFPLLQQLFAILAQVETAAHSRIRRVAHDALPKNVIEGHGVEAVLRVEVEIFHAVGPPCSVVQFRKDRSDFGRGAAACGDQIGVDWSRAQAARDDGGIRSEIGHECEDV